MTFTITKKATKDLYESVLYHMHEHNGHPVIYEYQGHVDLSPCSQIAGVSAVVESGEATVVANYEYLTYLSEEHSQKEAVEMLQEKINYYLEYEMEG